MGYTNRQNAELELEFINEELSKIGRRAIILKQSTCYTYNKGVVIVPIATESSDTGNWYYHSNKQVFKNWESLLNYLLGYRKALHTVGV